MSQLPIAYEPPAGPRFHYGPEYSAAKDQPRWSRHCAAVLAVLRGGHNPGGFVPDTTPGVSSENRWWTYEALAAASGVPAGSVRTRVSNLREQGVGIEVRTRADRFCEVRLA